jgi:hypothetical protein
MNTDTKHGFLSVPSHVSGFPTLIVRIACLAAFVGMLASASTLNTAFADDSEPQGMMSQDAPTPPATKGHIHGDKMDHSPQAMARHVEERIKTLHDKLGITSEQETQWADVAQTMRDNEAAIAALIETRHKNASGMTAIDDLQSYEDITQAHADAIKKLITSFHALYGEMSEDQQKNADKVFGSFEGHDQHAKKHK